ncbi:hypothetical protein ACOMHN_020164 [Nucella lapillus]
MRVEIYPFIPTCWSYLPAHLFTQVTPREVHVSDFLRSISTHRKTVSAEELEKFHHFTQHFGDSGW